MIVSEIFPVMARHSMHHVSSRFFLMTTKTIQAPMRKCVFYEDLMTYRDSRRKVQILLDQTALPLLWESTWNQWKHLLGAIIHVKATFVQNGRYRHRKGGWELETWQSPLPSRIEVTLPENILIKSQRPVKPIIALDSLPKPLSKFECDWNLRRSRETICDDSVLGLAFRAILRSL